MFPRFCKGPIARRDFLAAGVLGLGGLTLPDLYRLQATAKEAGRRMEEETSVIFIWLPGGPPHIDMYDMKPAAPSEYRGPFQPIRTNVAGMDVCELMPRHAALADKYAIICSIAHTFADHGGGHKRMMTGVIPATPTETVNDAPATGSIVAKYREAIDRGIPNYISLNPGGRIADTFAQGPAYLGLAYTPFFVQGDPTSPKFQVPNLAPIASLAGRIDDRIRLLHNFDQVERTIDATGSMESLDRFQQRSVSMLTSDRARKAFALSLEPETIRNRYGRHCWGQ